MNVAGHRCSDCINREITLSALVCFFFKTCVWNASSFPQPMGWFED